jgi:hypothetical protein
MEFPMETKTMRTRARKIIHVSMTALAVCIAPLGAADYAVVVNAASPVTDLSQNALIQILKAEKQSWDGGDKVFLIMPKEGSKEEDILCSKVYSTDSDGLKKYWTSQVFQNHMNSAPKNATNRVALKLVEEKPNAVAIINAKDVTPAVKIITIDGKKPGDAGYLLKE